MDATRTWSLSGLLAGAALSSIMLAGCGGGGDSGSGTPPKPAITASPSTVMVSAVVTDPAPTANVNVSFTNAPSTIYLVVNDTTTNGIASVSSPTVGSTSGSFAITFKTPSGLKPATYSDTATVVLCSDPQCRVVVASTSLPVTYTVNPATGSSAPQVTLDSQTESYAALYVDHGSRGATPDPKAFAFANFTAAPNVRVSVPPGGVITSAQFAMSDATHGGLTFGFVAPSSLTQKTYSTPVSVTVCIDPACVNPIANGSFTVTANYVVTNTITVPGTGGYTISAFPSAARFIAANPQSDNVYSLVGPSGSLTTDSIQSINAMTGTSAQTALALANSQNTTMALSDDGQYLYVTGSNTNAQVQQIHTPALTAGLKITTALNGAIAIQPGHPQTIALSGGIQLQIFDGATPRPNIQQSGGQFFTSVAWTSNPAVIAANLGGLTVEQECSYAVDANGLNGGPALNCVSDFFGNIAASNKSFVFVNGFGYGNASGVLSEATWKYTTNIAVPQIVSEDLVPDPQLGKVFAVGVDNLNNICYLQSFSLSTNAPIASLHLPAVADSGPSIGPTCGGYLGQLVRWGTNGVALSSGTDLIVVSGAFVGP